MRYTVIRSGASPPTGRVFSIGDNLKTGEEEFLEEFGSVTSLESDLLLLGAAIFAADRATLRGIREEYSRSITITLPVVNIGRLLPLVPQIEYILHRLSNDAWTIDLQQSVGTAEPVSQLRTSQGKTLLFSGGIDSLAAAVQFGEGPSPLQLVSHRTRNRITDSSQRRLVELLQNNGFNVAHHQYFVSSTDAGPNPFDHDVENSQRTRSFLFLVLGALVARKTGHHELVYLAENGQMAIHLPLNAARIGAFSTHTAHPEVLSAMEDFLARSLNVPIRIENPFLYMTKREVADIVTARIPEAIREATSCWRNSHLPAGISHCGDCVPCQVRRIALEYTGPDPTRYARDLWAEPVAQLGPEDDGRRNLADLTDFILRFRTGQEEELISDFPELISDAFDTRDAVLMYRRFSEEGFAVLGRYPGLRAFLT